MSHDKQVKRIAKVSINSFSKEGNGLGQAEYPEGKTAIVEVPFTMPGDEVEAVLGRKRKGMYHSYLENVVSPAPQRQLPRCLHFGSCGGCRWQHLPYAEQLQYKEQRVRSLVNPYLDKESVFHSIIACDPAWQYRNKMEFSFSSDKAGRRYLGLILDQSRGKVFNLTECHLVHPWFAEGVQAVRKWWEASSLDAYHPGKNVGSLRTLMMREGQRTGDRMVVLTVSGNPDYALREEHIQSFIKAIKAVKPEESKGNLAIFLRIQQIAKGMKTHFYEVLLDGPDAIHETLFINTHAEDPPQQLTFKISPAAFFQPNTRQAEKLYSKALQLIDIPKGSLIYDLYCGTGTLGICAASKAKRVIGIELTPESVLDARENAIANGLSNVTIYPGDVGHVLGELKNGIEEEVPSVVMVDPPRAGLEPKALQHVISLKADKILYISCNPVSQAANLEGLLQAGYRVEAVQPVDQFPQTLHVENIIVLRR